MDVNLAWQGGMHALLERPHPIPPPDAPGLGPLRPYTVVSAPIPGQKPGTSGLRKKVVEFQKPHYLHNFVQVRYAWVCRFGWREGGRWLLVVYARHAALVGTQRPMLRTQACP